MFKPLLLSMTAALIPLAGCGAKSKAPTPAPAAELLASVDIPHEQFTLENGLRVLVHTDRKAPVVAVSVWYDVGSKHEPLGKTGFAHLFEHLMLVCVMPGTSVEVPMFVLRRSSRSCSISPCAAIFDTA